MKKITILCRTVCAGLIVAATQSFANPTVSNIAVSQRDNTKLVDISYDVSFVGGDTVDISCEVSTNSGVSYDIPVSSFSGDYGANVGTGTGRLIVWNAGVDWNENYSEQMKVRITAEAPRFQVVDDGGLLILDNDTGLLWNQYHHASSFTYAGATGVENDDYEFFIGGIPNTYSGWRLPVHDDFLALATESTVTGLPSGHPFIISSSSYWSSSFHAYNTQTGSFTLQGFSFYERDGTGWLTGSGVYQSLPFIPMEENTYGKLLLVKEPE